MQTILYVIIAIRNSYADAIEVNKLNIFIAYIILKSDVFNRFPYISIFVSNEKDLNKIVFIVQKNPHWL